jgi:hypothetical protein
MIPPLQPQSDTEYIETFAAFVCDLGSIVCKAPRVRPPRALVRGYTIGTMRKPPKDSRTPAEKARTTARIIGSLKHEGYVPNAEDEAIHQQALRGEITSEEDIAIFRERGLQREQKARAPKRSQPG